MEGNGYGLEGWGRPKLWVDFLSFFLGQSHLFSRTPLSLSPLKGAKITHIHTKLTLKKNDLIQKHPFAGV